MKYQFVILVSDLQIVTDAYKEVGGYLEVIPDQEGKICMITFDNIDLLATEGLKVLEHSCVPRREPSEGLWSIKSEVIKALHEFYASNDIQKPSSKSDDIVRGEVIKVIKELYEDVELSTEIKTASGPVTIPSVDVNKIKLQRSKITEKKTFDFKLEKPRTKWELIKILQEEFDKFPDDTEFTSFSVLGIGVGRSHYL